MDASPGFSLEEDACQSIDKPTHCSSSEDQTIVKRVYCDGNRNIENTDRPEMKPYSDPNENRKTAGLTDLRNNPENDNCEETRPKTVFCSNPQGVMTNDDLIEDTDQFGKFMPLHSTATDHNVETTSRDDASTWQESVGNMDDDLETTTPDDCSSSRESMGHVDITSAEASSTVIYNIDNSSVQIGSGNILSINKSRFDGENQTMAIARLELEFKNKLIDLEIEKEVRKKKECDVREKELDVRMKEMELEDKKEVTRQKEMDLELEKARQKFTPALLQRPNIITRLRGRLASVFMSVTDYYDGSIILHLVTSNPEIFMLKSISEIEEELSDVFSECLITEEMLQEVNYKELRVKTTVSSVVIQRPGLEKLRESSLERTKFAAKNEVATEEKRGIFRLQKVLMEQNLQILQVQEALQIAQVKAARVTLQEPDLLTKGYDELHSRSTTISDVELVHPLSAKIEDYEDRIRKEDEPSFTSKGTGGKMEKRTSSNSEYKYDVFLSCHHEDVLYAKEILEKLEEKDFKVFIMARDAEPGTEIFEILGNVIPNCEHVIIILSRRYIEDKVNRFELHLSVVEKEGLVIPILYNSDDPKHFLKEEDLPPIFAALNYIKSDSDCFDERLLAALSAKKTIIGNPPVGSVAYGLAWSYFYGYLNIILKDLPERIRRCEEIWNPDISHRKVPLCMLLLIPKSCYCPANIEEVDSRISNHAHLPACHGSRWRSPKRPYPTATKKISLENGEEYFFVGEYVTPLHTIYEMEFHRVIGMSSGQKMKEVHRFYNLLKAILDLTNQERVHGKAVLHYYDDEAEKPYPLADRLVEIIKKEIQEDVKAETGKI